MAFVTAANSSLDEGVFAGGVEVGIKIAKEMMSTGEIFWGRSYAKRSVRDVASYSKGSWVEG